MVSKAFWDKKTLLSYVLAVLVFMIHISSLYNYTEHIGNDKFLQPFEWFVMAISRCAVPTFFILSGAVFFRDYKNTFFFSKLKSRVRTLLIPYLSWNTIWMLFGVVTTLYLSQFFLAREPSDLSPTGILLSILHYTDNGPFWFIFNLIIFVIASPFIQALLINRIIGLFALGGILFASDLGYGLPVEVFFEPESIVYYMVGAYIGIHAFEWFSTKRTSKSVTSIICILACIILRTYCKEAIDYMWLRTIVLTIYGVSLCFVFDLIPIKKLPTFTTHSFWIYAMHINVSAVVTKILFLAMPKTELFAWINFTITIAVTLLLIEITAVTLQLYFKPIYRILSGASK